MDEKSPVQTASMHEDIHLWRDDNAKPK